ncbi:MAG: hypothetical protein JSW40_04695, partial [Candidatus Omnitrophota bacterium]
ILLLCGIFGLLIYFYLLFRFFNVGRRDDLVGFRIKVFVLCLGLLYLVGGVYTQGWISKTTGFCFAMLLGILSNRDNSTFFIKKYLSPS